VSVERGSGVILRTRLLTETSLIVHWLTAEQGRIATVAKGARRPKSPFRGKLDLFYEAEFSFQRSRRSDLHTLREAVVTDTHPALRTRIENLRQAAYATALLEVATETETAIPTLHQLFRELLGCLGTEPAPPQLVLAFELKVLAESGLQPNLDRAGLNAGTRALAAALAGRPLSEALRGSPAPAQATELDRFLHRFIARHLERVPRGRAEALGTSAPPAAARPVASPE
jgi:DNA repair protein RecO (recombination protein O)